MSSAIFKTSTIQRRNAKWHKSVTEKIFFERLLLSIVADTITSPEFLTTFEVSLIMALIKKECMLHFWTTFVLRVIFIAASILLVLWFCSITVARIFGGRSWKKKAIIGAVGVVVITANFAKAHPVFFKRAHWTLAADSTLAGLMLAVGSVGIPSWTATICLAFSGPVCVPIAGSILVAIDVVIAAAVIWKTEGFEMHKKRGAATR